MRRMSVYPVVLIAVSLTAAIVLAGVAGTGVGRVTRDDGRVYAAEDTGTYRIASYIVRIAPGPDGSWIADYYQEWEVSGGRIPWVTVGLPDHGYAIRSVGGAAATVSRADYGSWSGVRVDLDREYVAGETFSFSFQVRQEDMGHRTGDAVTFAFVPGWYDRAEVERLEVHLKNPGSADDLLHASPEPSHETEDEVVWTTSLAPGERFKVTFGFSAQLFPEMESGTGADGRATGSRAPGYDGKRESAREAAGAATFALIVAVVAVLVVIIVAAASRGGYTGKRGIYYGTYLPVPPVGRSPWGSRPGHSSGRTGSGSSGGSRKSGGGGGFGGRSIGCACVSCACACVSCACACACAGGGGAGCARKFDGACRSPSAAVHLQGAPTPHAPGARGATKQAHASTAPRERLSPRTDRWAAAQSGALADALAQVLAHKAAERRTRVAPSRRQIRSSAVVRLLLAAAVCVWVLSAAAGCRDTAGDTETTSHAPPGARPYDENVAVPEGDPPFPALERYWVVDPEGLLGPAAVKAADETLEALRSDGLAEVVVVVQRGVKHAADWATHYGRWLMLGAREGPRQNNGLVFLIIPDARPEAGRVWYSVGRGLPRLTSSDLGPLMEEAASYANADDLDGAVVSVARNIDEVIRELYGEGEH